MYRFGVSKQFSCGGSKASLRPYTMSVRRKKVHFSRLCEFPGFLANKSRALYVGTYDDDDDCAVRVVMKQIESVPITNYFVQRRTGPSLSGGSTLKLSTLSEVFLAERQVAIIPRIAHLDDRNHV